MSDNNFTQVRNSLSNDQIKQAQEMVAYKQKLSETPVEAALPLFGLTKKLSLRKLGCFDPYVKLTEEDF